MEIFKVVAKIKYKENFFYILINKACQIYFIKEFKDGSIIYPNEDEFNELANIFYKSQVLASFKFNKNYKIDPKVILRNGKLVGLATVMFLSGCSSTFTPQQQNVTSLKNNTVIEKEIPTIEEVLQKGGYDFHSIYNYEDMRLYRIHIYVTSTSQRRVIECQNFEEFGNYIETKVNPTFEDVIETINNNESINEKYRNWLLEGLENLRQYMPNVNLTVLNYNMSRLQLEEKTPDELEKTSETKNLAGLFDPKTGKAYFIDSGDEESNKFIFYHEVLGHGLSEASFECDVDESFEFGQSGNQIQIKKEEIGISTSIFLMRVLNDGIEANPNEPSQQFMYVGQGFGEGLADIIAKYAMNDKKIKGHPYIESAEQLRIMCETVGLSLEDYISQGGAEILSKAMQENEVDNSLSYIVSNDIYVSAMKSNEIELVDERDNFKSNILTFFYDYSDDKIARGISKRKIVKKLSKILSEGGEYIVSTFTGEEINYNDISNKLMEELEDQDERN